MTGYSKVDIDEIRLNYRLAKFFEGERKAIDQKLVSFARVFLTNWTPGGDEKDRKKQSSRAQRVVEDIRKGNAPSEGDEELYGLMTDLVMNMETARATLEQGRKERRKLVEKAASKLPAWERLADVKGFSPWGLGVIIGEFGDLTDNLVDLEDRQPGKSYSGVRRIYKRFGLAPDECYGRGEKSTGRMIPRSTRGRIIGILFDPLLKWQWAAERGPNGEALKKESEKGVPGNIPAHPVGPYGVVYGETKARHVAVGKTNGHAFNLARRAMVKALIHDVHRAWHGLPADYSINVSTASQNQSEIHYYRDRGADTLPTPNLLPSQCSVESHFSNDRRKVGLE